MVNLAVERRPLRIRVFVRTSGVSYVGRMGSDNPAINGDIIALRNNWICDDQSDITFVNVDGIAKTDFNTVHCIQK